MRFHGLMLLRDEADVIGETLRHLLTWVDVLHIYDLGSTDGTWDIVQDFAARDTRIAPFKREPTVFSDSLRCVLFDHLRDRFEKGDWICKLDGDEFYPFSPPQYVRERLSPAEGMVYLQWYYFRMTTREALDCESGNVSILEERKRPIGERRRYYKVSEFSEPRMFRYRPSMRWSEINHWPYNAGLLARERLPVLHYPHRDPCQMARRFALRAAMKRRAAAAGNHWNTADWRADLVDHDTGIAIGSKRDVREGLSGDYGIDTGPLLYWEPGTELPEVRIYSHLPHWSKRSIQRMIYGVATPFLDRLRPRFDKSSRPTLITEAENTAIGAECAAAEQAFLNGESRFQHT